MESDELKEGIYEQLITSLVRKKIQKNNNKYFIKEIPIDPEKAVTILSLYILDLIQRVLRGYSGENKLNKQIELSNKIIQILLHEIKDEVVSEDFIETSGKILKAALLPVYMDYPVGEQTIEEIFPYTGLLSSNLLIGESHGKITFANELKKEILSSDKIFLLVSFIKWSGLVLIINELKQFCNAGKELNIVSTASMGISDTKALKELANLPNTKLKISYNGNEKLHAKSYIFIRKTGFNTAYVGSSNLSRNAITNGFEWNAKLTSKEVPHLIDKIIKGFSAYWNDEQFTLYDPTIDSERLENAFKSQKTKDDKPIAFIDVTPKPFQQTILENLKVEREIHHRHKNLVVAATGTGKTYIAAFDFACFLQKNKNAKLLFIAHRKEIIQQAVFTFRNVIRDGNFGELWFDGIKPEKVNNLFSTIITFNNNIEKLNLPRDYYDFIIIDEVHHIAADSYRSILKKFTPKILLGLTATPERMDGQNILSDFNNTIAAEIRLPEAINEDILAPFNYFGISDNADLRSISWVNGRYQPSELTNIFTNNDSRTALIIDKCKYYLSDYQNVCALGFCVSVEHAKYMAEKFIVAGLKADYLVAERNEYRDELNRKLRKKIINYLFVVDIFNEGVDIPEIDTVLFLRPTESLTIFLQQLGRGLRKINNKECLTVLDFVGNARAEYNFEEKFRAIIGKTKHSTLEEIEKDFPILPLGCSIIIEKKAKEYILNNIRGYIAKTKNNIVNLIINFQHRFNNELNLKNFCKMNNLTLERIYKSMCWTEFLYNAKIINEIDRTDFDVLTKMVFRKWLICDSYSYLSFVLMLAKNNFNVTNFESETDKLMINMLYYDFYTEARKYNTINDAIKQIGRNEFIKKEIIEFLEYRLDIITHMEYEEKLPYNQPLMVHSRYTRDQILSAFNFNTYENKSRISEGVAYNKELNTELIFITLEKSEDDYSPTTMYNDYAINDLLFHWQSQNATAETSPKGSSYINHSAINKNILLFLRESKKDEYKRTQGYVFLGRAKYDSHNGSKPMNIIWKLERPLPNNLKRDAEKLAV